MIKFKVFISSFFLSLLVIILSACNSQSENENNLEICPQCHMKLPVSNIHTSTMNQDGEMSYYDDIGCMILWIEKNNIDVQNVQIKIYSNDTKKYIDAKSAFYKFNEKTPMMYGFSAYEKSQDNSINFDEVYMRMLRGEHMANPKIRKQILGY